MDRRFERSISLLSSGACICVAYAGLTGCGSGGPSGSSLPSSANAVALRSEPQSVVSIVAPTAGAIRPSALPGGQVLCVGGTTYATVQDDEFSADRSVNYTSNLLTTTPAPDGAMWSSRANGFASDHSRNNVGTDDAYYTDPARGFGGYNPYSLSGGALNIQAEPVPAPYATNPALLGGHWLSGLLESPALTYGYIEISAKIPNLQGFWPAPLWLLGLSGDDGRGNGYEELDVNELFGNALPPSTVQQTQIFSPSGNPPANEVRTLVSPDPSLAYHTYSVLWTPQNVRYYIDRVQRSPAYPNAANGPANAIISLQVFALHTWAPPPANGTPHSMSVQYYRWYQSRNTNCSPSGVGTAPPTPTPMPSPEATGAPSIAQNTGLIAYHNESTLLGQFAHPPATGDTLIAFINAWIPVATPPGWNRVDAPKNNGYFVFTGIVGRNGLASSANYAFGLNWGLIQVLDITKASQSAPILASADPNEYQSQFPRTLSIPKTGGLLLSGWGGYSSLQNGFSSIAEQLPSGQLEKVLTYSLNDSIGSSGSFSFRLAQITTEPFAAPNPFTVVETAVDQDWTLNGDLLWVPPAQ